MKTQLSPLAYMNFNGGTVVRDNMRITPLMSNAGVYESHITERLNNYGECFDRHISTYDSNGNLMSRHTLSK